MFSFFQREQAVITALGLARSTKQEELIYSTNKPTSFKVKLRIMNIINISI